ncbi:MAG: protoporphyrinogen oxidase [Pirellulales bacterium]|nr:protoporphyrinogen oxidase [Pirellulales bacterium]
MTIPQRVPRRIAVVGGGIAGLAAAQRLVECASGDHLRLFEAGPRLGGVIETVHEQGFQVEASSDNFITTLPYGLELCRRLGLADQLVQTDPRYRQTYVVHRGRLHKLPEGFLMMAPTRLWPLALTPLLSPWGKFRAAMEYFLPPRRDEADESMAAFATRRLGRETFDRLVEPLVGAIYAGDVDRLSVKASLSRFRDMEREHGSLIRAMRRQMAARRRSHRKETQSGARYSLFVTLRGGLGTLVDAIAASLPAGCARLDAPVERIDRVEGGAWRVHAGGTEETFDALILAAPSHVAGQLLAPIDAELGQLLGRIDHTGTAIVSLGFDRSQIAHPMAGAGAVVGRIERSPILAVSFSSQKYPHRAPEGKTLLRIFAGGANAPEVAQMEDDRLAAVILAELRPLLGISGEPVYRRTARWPRIMPQYYVGHQELVGRIEDRVAGLPGLALAGNAYHGVGIPDCIHGGQRAAQRVLDESR